MFTPKWKKEAKLLYKGSKKFVNYKRDLMEEDKIAAIEEQRAELRKAIKAGDKEAAARADKDLTKACESSLPRYRRPNALEENIEVFFVAIVIALGIRAYYLQPFRIPTGSMQPTLNGITGQYVDRAEFPGWPTRIAQGVLRGSGYVYKKLDRERTFVSPDARESIREVNFLWVTFTKLHFTDGTMWVHAPSNVLANDLGLGPAIGLDRGRITRMTVPKGTILASGRVNTGDLVLVDKVSYNFRRPKRGEVWVFDTRGIKGIHQRSGPQGAGSHYIKRLAGLPGDTLRIEPPTLYLNDEKPTERKLVEVMTRTGPFSDQDENKGYLLANPRTDDPRLRRWLDDPRDEVTLKKEAPYGYREYFSLGDNTNNSLDSRYWGPVNEYNAVGPALFSLWPITTGHWGLIK